MADNGSRISKNDAYHQIGNQVILQLSKHGRKQHVVHCHNSYMFISHNNNVFQNIGKKRERPSIL